MSSMTDTTDGRAMHEVHDGERTIRFEGDLLASGTSERNGKPRWIELQMYKTRGGKYIVSGIGRTQMPTEHDRYWAHVSETPQGAIESLHLFDGDGVKYLTRIAKQVLADAMRRDEDLHQAFLIETVD